MPKLLYKNCDKCEQRADLNEHAVKNFIIELVKADRKAGLDCDHLHDVFFMSNLVDAMLGAMGAAFEVTFENIAKKPHWSTARKKEAIQSLLDKVMHHITDSITHHLPVTMMTSCLTDKSKLEDVKLLVDAIAADQIENPVTTDHHKPN